MTKSETYEWDTHYSDRYRKVEARYEYDSLARITEAVLSNNDNDVCDSQRYTYSEQQLRSAEHWKLRGKQLVPTTRTQYYDWDPARFISSQIYASAEEYSNPPELAIGYAPYKIASVQSWNSFDSTYRPWYRVVNELNAEGHLARHSVIDSSGYFGSREYTYYPSGDVETIQEITSINNLRLATNRNTYNSRGLLVSSEQEWAGSRIWRFTATYMTSSVHDKEEGMANGEGVGGRLSTIYDALGRSVWEFANKLPELESLDLPSGLYFISIDGGKPRKHLIP
jgi:hypothetical protein